MSKCVRAHRACGKRSPALAYRCRRRGRHAEASVTSCTFPSSESAGFPTATTSGSSSPSGTWDDPVAGVAGYPPRKTANSLARRCPPVKSLANRGVLPGMAGSITDTAHIARTKPARPLQPDPGYRSRVSIRCARTARWDGDHAKMVKRPSCEATSARVSG